MLLHLPYYNHSIPTNSETLEFTGELVVKAI